MANAPAYTVEATETPAEVVLSLAGLWRLGQPLPDQQKALGAVRTDRPLWVDGSQIEGWDSTLLLFLARLGRHCREQGVELRCRQMPEGVDRLLELSKARPERADAKKATHQYDFLSRLGYGATDVVYSFGDLLSFIGGASQGIARILTGRSQFRWREMGHLMSACGAEALPIVSLISFLVGVILAFVSTVQLELFGASIYVANLVGLGMARDMAAMMAAIIMAGRTGAAYAAQLGTMQVNEEIDALKTLGVPPMDLLVLPRLLALTLMMPLLAIYANFMGILGGAVTTSGISEITFAQYFYQTMDAVPIRHFVAGLIKSAVYGVLVAMAGCLHGLRCGRSAQAVGLATTSAVVSGIIWIVVACAVITVMYYAIGF